MIDDEVTTMLRDAAATPSRSADIRAIRERGHQLGRHRRVGCAATAAAVVGVIALGIGLSLRDGDGGSSVQTAAKSQHPRVYIDERNGMTVRIPRGWHRNATPPNTVQRLSVNSKEQTTLCNGSRRPSVGVYILEVQPSIAARSPQLVPRPAVFGPDTGLVQEGDTGPNGCFSPTGQGPGQAIFFSDEGRAFQVTLILYPDASPKRQSQAYEILNSLRFVPDAELNRPPVTNATTAARTPTAIAGASEVRVLVLNGSGVPNLATNNVTTLRGLGYGIAGIGDAPARTGTLVQCRPGLGLWAARLANVYSPIATTAPFPSPPPAEAPNTDCIVTLGSFGGQVETPP